MPGPVFHHHNTSGLLASAAGEEPHNAPLSLSAAMAQLSPLARASAAAASVSRACTAALLLWRGRESRLSRASTRPNCCELASLPKCGDHVSTLTSYRSPRPADKLVRRCHSLGLLVARVLQPLADESKPPQPALRRLTAKQSSTTQKRAGRGPTAESLALQRRQVK